MGQATMADQRGYDMGPQDLDTGLKSTQTSSEGPGTK